MQWEFTAEDVVQGQAGYGLAEFRRDLWHEVGINLPGAVDNPEQQKLFALVYDLYYWLATGGDLAGFERELNADPNMSAFLHMVHRHSEANITMLGAILQRSIMDGVEAGMSLETAVAAAAARNKHIAREAPLAPPEPTGTGGPGCPTPIA